MADRSGPSHGAQKSPSLECDIVMAGGVTSGIIYPGAVAMIARRYRFRSIGGTSVGAIAAAVTAAAEYGRQTGRNPTSFDQVAALSKSLGDLARDGHSRLFHLFTPEPSTKPLLSLVTPVFSGVGRLAQILSIFARSMSSWQVAIPVLIVIVAAASIIIQLALDARWAASAIAVLMTIASILVTWTVSTGIVLARKWLPAWRSNGYGICTGLTSPECGRREDQPQFQGLTSWMHAQVQAAAGRKFDDAPLTFGELWGANDLTSTVDPRTPRSIELSMITSDISRNRTAQLPFLETPSPLYIESEVLDRYFPSPIVAWIKDRAGEYDRRVERRGDVIRLPSPQDLPIVFGARLSLSFPILLSALPLMTPDFAKRRSDDRGIPLRRVWYSDGGLTSNFPIHFFDSPIPTRPTFGVNLVDFDAEAPNIEADDDGQPETAPNTPDRNKPIAEPRAGARTAAQRPARAPVGDPAPRDAVWGFVSMAKGNRFAPVPFTSFDDAPGSGVISFAFTLVNTARYWSDNQMLVAPGVRDRVVNVALREDEGGLNLDMSPSVISDLDWRGRAAGLLISARFDPQQQIEPETGNTNEQMFANHRWIRYRNFMASFEDLSRRFAASRRASDDAAAARGESPLADMISGSAKEKLGYPAPVAAHGYYRDVTDDLERLAFEMAAATQKDKNATFDLPGGRSGAAAPRPKMRNRLRPLADNDPRSESADALVPMDRTLRDRV
jgi:predicted acylesterase/phospholipase RssA